MRYSRSMAADPEPTSVQAIPAKTWSVPIIPLIVGLVLVFAWRTFLTAYANLIPDECSYWTWSRTLDWSYFDNSGMVAYLIRLSTDDFRRKHPVFGAHAVSHSFRGYELSAVPSQRPALCRSRPGPARGVFVQHLSHGVARRRGRGS